MRSAPRVCHNYDSRPRCDVTINEKEEIQDLNNELETFMAEVEDLINYFILLFIDQAIIIS